MSVQYIFVHVVHVHMYMYNVCTIKSPSVILTIWYNSNRWNEHVMCIHYNAYSHLFMYYKITVCHIIHVCYCSNNRWNASYKHVITVMCIHVHLSEFVVYSNSWSSKHLSFHHNEIILWFPRHTMTIL